MLLASPAQCNDSSASTPLGGLVLLKSDSIVMVSEDLFISAKKVHVRYRYVNESDHDIETTVAFPLPEIPVFALDPLYTGEFWTDVPSKFKTTVDGVPVELKIIEQAFIGDKDITERVQAAGLPINWYSHSGKLSETVKALWWWQRNKLKSDGLLDSDLFAKWNVRTTVTRLQNFPAHKPVIVEHEYIPLSGGAVQPIGADVGQDFSEDKIRDYCMKDGWMRSAEKKARAINVTDGRDVIVQYVLKTGANWKGPICDFRLVIDKGEPAVLMAFCADGAIKKISATQVEVHKMNFTPTRDLGILFLHLQLN